MNNVSKTTAGAGPLTIALTSYNYASYITEAIESVVRQTSPHWRLVIFDNKSTDNTIDVIRPYLSDDRITLVSRGHNIGQRSNLLQAFAEIDTEFVSTLQADDFLDPTFVETALGILSSSPRIPFVIFNWHHYHEHPRRRERNRRKQPHDSSPFAPNRAGPLLLAPYLSVANFVPLHMAVFRTEFLPDVLACFSKSPINQLGEQLILKLLEDQHGPGHFTGTYGGVWRRHKAQLTERHLSSSMSVIEEPIERLWYVTHAPEPKPLNVFMALITFIRYSGRVDYLTAMDWLLDQGVSFTESFGLCLATDRLRFRQAALAVGLKFSTYSAVSLIGRKQLLIWLESSGVAPDKSALISVLQNVLATEGELFIRQDEIEAIIRHFWIDESPVGFTPLFRTLQRRRALTRLKALSNHLRSR